MFNWFFRPKPEWPVRVRFGAIAKKLRQLQVNGHRDEFRYFDFPPKTWLVLSRVPIPNCVTTGMINHQLVKRYAALKTPFPPLVASSHGWIIDGIQRLYAARDRGDKFINVYAPENAKSICLS